MSKPRITLDQGQLAELIGVGRDRVNEWQKRGLPYIPGGKGKESVFIAPVAIHWHMGRKTASAKGWHGVQLRDCLDAIAFGHALISREGGNIYRADEVVHDLKLCGVSRADDYPQRLGYFTHLVEHRTGG